MRPRGAPAIAARLGSGIRGYTFKWGHRVVVDPVNPGMIYITTYGGSVWHGPAQPRPDVAEDIPNPVSRSPVSAADYRSRKSVV